MVLFFLILYLNFIYKKTRPIWMPTSNYSYLLKIHLCPGVNYD